MTNQVNLNNERKTIIIYHDTSSDSMVGGFGWGNYDAKASTEEFVRLVLMKIREEYPDYEIDFNKTNSRSEIEFIDDRDVHEWKSVRDDEERISNIFRDVWLAQNWYIEAANEQ